VTGATLVAAWLTQQAMRRDADGRLIGGVDADDLTRLSELIDGTVAAPVDAEDALWAALVPALEAWAIE
jgi:hypothetical protein